MTARNIRFDSLCPNREVATQDCPLCVKRRIKCDRSLPTCVKCASRDLDCPGYHPVPLKWNQGVASRGKFAGRSTPVLDKDIRKAKKHKLSKRRAAEVEVACTSPQPEHTPSSLPETTLDLHTSTDVPHPCQDLQLVHNISSITLSNSLLNHFCTRVIPRLTWIDLPGSPWRKTILPLAENSTCLRLAISSLAAAHIHTTSTETTDQTARLLQMQTWLRDESLRVLNQKMRLELQPAHGTVPAQTSQSFVEILTAMLVLCYTEAFIPGSRDWKLHLRACRTLINFGNLRSRRTTPNGIESFILKEVADLDTLCNISVFTDDSTSLSEPFGDTRIWSFTGVINDITTVERQRHHARRKDQQLTDINMEEWRQRAQNAYTEVSAKASTLSEDQDMRQCFQAVVRAHYHATIIYSYQAFAPADEVQELVKSTIDILLREMQSVLAGHVHTFSHDLFLPCFIAGTECRGDKLRQSIIERLFLDSLSVTGLWCNHTALQFLKTLWGSSEYEMGMNWIQYARQNEAQIGTFIAF
ncbi:Zn(2)-C6 fungal-type domain-containing protein [Fusarium sp. LHS14.1]|nr:Zn(2)-C6 fungal-type domain-containing protein [Fusarium sp. LHS14.1]